MSKEEIIEQIKAGRIEVHQDGQLMPVERAVNTAKVLLNPDHDFRFFNTDPKQEEILTIDDAADRD